MSTRSAHHLIVNPNPNPNPNSDTKPNPIIGHLLTGSYARRLEIM